MRAYIDGILSTQQEIFIPEDLWFATKDCSDNTFVSKSCMCLSGLTCESSIKEREFSCRWKGVVLTYINESGEEIETEDFTVKEFLQMISSKEMELVNASAYFDTDVNMKITNFTLVDKDTEEHLDVDNIEEIEFLEG